MKKSLLIALIGTSFTLMGCQTPSVIDTVLDNNGETQLQVRSYQSRIFDTHDKAIVMRAAIATLQDYGFIISKTDYELGTISAIRDIGGSHLYDEAALDPTRKTTQATVTVTPKGKNLMSVRMNATFRQKPIKEPKIYQDFFAALSKSLFLTAHAVD
ncbi:MAG: hypothetical protein IKI30_04610 [Oxalobacter sp.]|nr:hypothetical protein [Oxalobacter sp.]